VLSNIDALGSQDFAQEHLSQTRAIGDVPMARFNVMGGSIALGHPFAATAARQIISVSHELRRRKERYGLVAQCAAGGMGAAVIVENPEARS
jgi:acetyl-CoA acyltransferase